MQWFEYLIIIALILFVTSVIFFHFYLKKKGKSLTDECSSCNGNCKGCHTSCHKMIEEYHKENS